MKLTQRFAAGFSIATCVLTGALQAGSYPSKTSNKALDALRGIPVVASSYIGERSSFEAFDTTTLIPNVNQDIRLLEQKQKLENAFRSRGESFPRYGMIDVSGRIEAQGVHKNNYEGNKKGSIDLAGVELDFTIHASNFGIGFMNIAYDDDPPKDGTPLVGNSRLYVDQAFFTFGNLNEQPFYASVGQLYLPFGQYSSSMLSAPLTKKLGEMHKRALVLGVKTPGDYSLHAAVYAFNGELRPKGRGGSTFGAHLGYHFNHDGVSGKLAGGLVSNLAEAKNFLSSDSESYTETHTSTNAFAGFKKRETFTKRVTGANLHGSISYNNFSLTAEGVAALRSFDIADLSYKAVDDTAFKAAKPWATNVELAYQFQVSDKPVLAAVGYGHTKHGLSLGLPERRISGAITTALWPSTLQAIEVRYDKNYKVGTQSTAMNTTMTSRGKSHTMVTLHFGYYF